ncbi:MAG: hypothetical protein ABWX67_07105 [Allosphingosinicella sp.]
MAAASSPSTGARIHAALEALYRAFETRAPSAIEGCPCCIETRGVDLLLNLPLRDLSGQQLWRYVSGAFLTIGGERDFRYFLPRILDISVTDPGNANDPEIVLGKLALANWRSWRSDERRAVEELVDAWFEQVLAEDLAEADEYWIGHESESVLCGASRAGLSLTRWLVRLHEPLAAPVLADLKQRFPDRLSAFWEDAPAGLEELSVILAPGRP